MAKWDSSGQLPESFKEHGINILPDSRSSYILSDFVVSGYSSNSRTY